MLKMDEVFKLPLSNSAEFLYRYGEEYDWCLASFDTTEEASHAAHAINNVDVLAAALRQVLLHMEKDGDTVNSAYINGRSVLCNYLGLDVNLGRY